jgi:hypothetical protein
MVTAGVTFLRRRKGSRQEQVSRRDWPLETPRAVSEIGVDPRPGNVPLVTGQ